MLFGQAAHGQRYWNPLANWTLCLIETVAQWTPFVRHVARKDAPAAYKAGGGCMGTPPLHCRMRLGHSAARCRRTSALMLLTLEHAARQMAIPE